MKGRIPCLGLFTVTTPLRSVQVLGMGHQWCLTPVIAAITQPGTGSFGLPALSLFLLSFSATYLVSFPVPRTLNRALYLTWSARAKALECPGGATRRGELVRTEWLWIDLATYRHREVPNIVRNTCAARVDLMFVPRVFIATSSAQRHYSSVPVCSLDKVRVLL